MGASFAATAAREGLERALAQAERREESGVTTSLDDTFTEAEGGGGPGGGGCGGGGPGGGGGGGAPSFWLDCLRSSF